MKPSLLFTAAFSLSTLSAAWTWQGSVDEVDLVHNHIFKRQGDSNSNSQSDSSSQPASSQSSQSDSSSSSNTQSNSNSQSTTASNSKSNSDSSTSATGKTSGSDKSSKPTKTTTSSVSINPAAGAGGIALISPATTLAASQYYKVDNNITWVWNYTSLTSPPAAIDILATLAPRPGFSAVPSPYTLATNVSFEATQSFTWDTGAFTAESSPLPVGTYTLLVYDAALSTYSATASPGYLGLYNQFAFGMYTGQPRVDLTDPFVCATCNAAGRGVEKAAWGAVAGMAALAVGSGLWFAGTWGAF